MRERREKEEEESERVCVIKSGNVEESPSLTCLLIFGINTFLLSPQFFDSLTYSLAYSLTDSFSHSLTLQNSRRGRRNEREERRKKSDCFLTSFLPDENVHKR